MKTLDRLASYARTNHLPISAVSAVSGEGLTGPQRRRAKHKIGREAARIPKGIQVDYKSGRSRVIELPPRATAKRVDEEIRKYEGRRTVERVTIVRL